MVSNYEKQTQKECSNLSKPNPNGIGWCKTIIHFYLHLWKRSKNTSVKIFYVFYTTIAKNLRHLADIFVYLWACLYDKTEKSLA